MADLVRNLITEVVHKPDCIRRGSTTGHWNYASNLTLDQVSEETHQYPWLHLCRSCLPGACRCGKCAKAGA